MKGKKPSKVKRQIENIPQGVYCYDDEIELCPYWDMDESKPPQNNGYCHFLKQGDWESETLSLLWNKCKECTVFTEINEYNWSDGRKFETMRLFFSKLSLWGTITETYGFFEKFFDFVIHGKICRCKFCKKYFLRQADATNVTCCNECWIKSMRRRYRR